MTDFQSPGRAQGTSGRFTGEERPTTVQGGLARLLSDKFMLGHQLVLVPAKVMTAQDREINRLFGDYHRHISVPLVGQPLVLIRCCCWTVLVEISRYSLRAFPPPLEAETETGTGTVQVQQMKTPAKTGQICYQTNNTRLIKTNTMKRINANMDTQVSAHLTIPSQSWLRNLPHKCDRQLPPFLLFSYA